MSNSKKVKITKGVYVALAFVAAMVLVLTLNISGILKLVLELALLGLFLFIRRGFIFLYRAAALLQNGQYDKAWPKLEKAYKSGVGDEGLVMIGSAYVQYGDPKRGLDILDEVSSKAKDENLKNNAIITASMGYWRLGDLDKAIEVLTAVKESGYCDTNLLVNLETYLLKKGDLPKALEIIKEGRKDGLESNGLLDNRGWYNILAGEWKKAADVYDELIDDRNARFPEAYLHGAQISIHNGNISQAIDRLSWGNTKIYSSTCLTSKNYVDKLLLGLQNPKTRDAFAKAMEENYKKVACSEEFEGFELACEFDPSIEGVILPNEKPVYDPNKKVSQASSEETINTDVDEDDDRIPNTDLGDDE